MNGSLLDYLFVVSFLLLLEGTTSLTLLFSVVGINNILININNVKNLWKPSSTIHLSKLFEAYHVLQNQPDPKFKQLFNNMTSNVEISTTANAVVAGSGLIAKQQQQQQQIPKGQVVALYPIHSLGYANGKDPPVVHIPTIMEQSESYYYNDTSQTKRMTIVGTSDLICYQDEARHFGVGVVEEDRIDDDNNNKNNEQETILFVSEKEIEEEEEEEIDYSYTMLDPSGRYVFDVNPSRSLPNDLFVAHFVNDAAAANFSSLAVDKEEDDDVVIDTALRYLNDSMTNFNCVMTPFGPPPLMAYVTIKPVDVGKEFLASYGLNYWLGKVKDEDTAISIRHILDRSMKVQNKLEIYDNHIDLVLEEAVDTVHSAELYKTQTKMIKEIIQTHMRKSHRRPSSSLRQRLLSWWNKKRRPKF